jgi:hypothetical protein
MNLLEDLPEDVLMVLVGTLYIVSKVSIVVFTRVNKLCYRITSRCAIEYRISRSLKCHEIAIEGSLEVLKWARSEGCPWDSNTCSWAAENGHLEVLKWARSEGCPWDSSTCYWAAHNGHLEILKWARFAGCKWTQETEDLAKQKWPNIFS